MVIYILILICVYISSYFKNRNIIHAGTFLFLSLILALRDISVGTDTANYLNMVYGWNYEISISINSLGREMEAIWFYFVNYIYSSNYSSRWIIIVPAFLNIFFIYLAYAKFKINIGVAVFFYVILTFYFLDFNITRQCLAMSIILFGSSYLIGEQKYLFLIFVLIATLIHFSAVMCILFYFVEKVEVKDIILYLLLLLSLLVGIMGINLDFLELSIYESYSDNLSVSDAGSLNRIVMRGILTIFAVYFVYKKNDVNLFVLKMFVLSICVSNISLNMHPFISRASHYFTMFQPIFYSAYFGDIFLNPKTISKKTILLYSLILIYLIYWVYYLNINSGEIVPYRFYGATIS